MCSHGFSTARVGAMQVVSSPFSNGTVHMGNDCSCFATATWAVFAATTAVAAATTAPAHLASRYHQLRKIYIVWYITSATRSATAWRTIQQVKL